MPAAPNPTADATQTVADLANVVSPSIVQVITDTGEGSGVKIAAGVLTNAHVVSGALTIQVTTSDRRSALASIVRLDNTSDLALLQTGVFIPSLEMESLAQQRQGDDVLVLGYPLGLREGGGSPTITRGIISGFGSGGANQTLIQTDAAINHVNSGGS